MDNQARNQRIAWSAAFVLVVFIVAMLWYQPEIRNAGHEASDDESLAVLDKKLVSPRTVPEKQLQHDASTPSWDSSETTESGQDRAPIDNDTVTVDATPDRPKQERAKELPSPVSDASSPLESGARPTADSSEVERAVVHEETQLLTFERAEIENLLADAEDEGQGRDELLSRYGKSASGSGRFAFAAAAYQMFLEEFGQGHEFSPQIAMRLGNCLAPLAPNSGVTHTRDGPVIKPQWRMHYEPNMDLVRTAIDAYETAVAIAPDDRSASEALFKLGWVYRALQDLESSTDAWRRCAAIGDATKFAADAQMFAAENLTLLGRPAEAAEMMTELAASSTDHSRAMPVSARARDLSYRASRTEADISNPVAVVKREIVQRHDELPHAVYRSVANWLRAKRADDALVELHRWACHQDRWPEKQRLICRLSLADALLRSEDATQEAQQQAADALAEAITISPDATWGAPGAIRRSQLLRKLRQYDGAFAAFEPLDADVLQSSQWEPLFLTEKIRVRIAQGKIEEARELLDNLTLRYSDYVESANLEVELFSTSQENPQ